MEELGQSTWMAFSILGADGRKGHEEDHISSSRKEKITGSF